MNIELTKIECTDNRVMVGIAELAENIKAIGLINPITLAKNPEDAGKPYRVIAGRRRFRACQSMDRAHLTPDEYRIIDGGQELVTFCENFHRADLTLAEEVDHLAQLNTGRMTIRDLAAVLGKTPEYVALRLNLANLSPSWKKVLNAPADYPQWTPAKLELIAKQPAEVQEERKYWIDRAITVSEISDQLARGYMALKAAPFDVSGCADCPKRSGAAEMLFPELSDRGDTCLDRACFEAKLLPAVLAEIAAIKKRLAGNPEAEPFYLFFEQRPNYGSDAYKALGDIEYDSSFVREKKGKKEPNAYCTWGAGAGTYCRVKPKCSWVKPLNPKAAAGGRDGGDGAKPGKTLEDRETELKGKRGKFAVEKLCEDMSRGDGIGFPPPETRIILELIATYGCSCLDGMSWKPLPEARKELKQYKTDAVLIEQLWKDVQRRFREKLQYDISGTLDTIKTERAEIFCKFFNLDWNAHYWEPAVAAIPASKALLKARAEAEEGK